MISCALDLILERCETWPSFQATSRTAFFSRCLILNVLMAKELPPAPDYPFLSFLQDPQKLFRYNFADNSGMPKDSLNVLKVKAWHDMWSKQGPPVLFLFEAWGVTMGDLCISLQPVEDLWRRWSTQLGWWYAGWMCGQNVLVAVPKRA